MSERAESFDLVICIRCHAHVPFILDTADSVKCCTNSKTTKLICAVDGKPRVAAKLEKRLPGHVYCSPTNWGWGAGLYGLLAESITWASERWKFSHFLSIDYDTLFIGEGADQLLLDLITDPEVGLLGVYHSQNVHWKDVFLSEYASIKANLGSIPKTYSPGEGVQGGMMLMTNAFLRRLSEEKMLQPPYSNAKAWTRMADDHLVCLLCRKVGLSIAAVTEHVCVKWHLDRDPLGLERQGIKIFHPTKIRPQALPAVEKRVRNYYRSLRERNPLK